MDKARIVLAIIAGLALTTCTADLAKLLPLPEALSIVRYLRSGISYLIDIAGMVLLSRIVGGVGFSEQWSFVGLGKPWQPAAIMGLCIFAPVFVASMVFGDLGSGLSASSIVFLGVVAPFAEEVTYRGLAIGALVTLAGWRFWPAALFPALVFGLAHAAQGDGLEQAAMIVAITGVGGLFFGWLYQRFDYNLWPAIVIHIGMNVVWNLFEFGTNAIGDVLGNLLRAVTVIAAIGFAIWGRDWLSQKTGRPSRLTS